MSYDFHLDIEVYDEDNGHPWVQGKYLVHGYSDVMWTDDLDKAIAFIRDEIITGEEVEKEHRNYD